MGWNNKTTEFKETFDNITTMLMVNLNYIFIYEKESCWLYYIERVCNVFGQKLM